MSYTAQKANRVLTIAEEKAEEYAKMGYVISNESGEMVIEPENLERKVVELEAKLKEATLYVENLERKVVELKEKLEEATLYAENADKKIDELQKENAELKAKISELETKKTTSKSTKKTDQEA